MAVRRAVLGQVATWVLAGALCTGLASSGAAAAPTAFCDSRSAAEHRVRAFEGDARPELAAADLICRTPAEIRTLAARHGLEGHGRPDPAGRYRKFRDPHTDLDRLRLDAGHVDATTGRPYKDPRAAMPHVHGYYPSGQPILDPATGNRHFPLRTR